MMPSNPSRFFLFCLLLVSHVAQGQEFQNGWSYRHVAVQKYFRLNYENDVPFGTDRYFTQGVHFEIVSPRIGRLPIRHLMLHRKGDSIRYGIALESAGYTPANTFADSILRGDRPYAGTAYLKAFSIAVNEARKERITTALTLGWMGPAAGGYEIQSGIHELTGDTKPEGWRHQVGNALILNYEASYERLMFQRRRFLLAATGMARAGTYNIKAAVGGILMGGWFDHPFRTITRHRKMQLYVYAHPQFNFVGYNATLQGGLFSNNSPYTISSIDMLRTVFRFDGGIRAGYNNAWLSIYARYLTKEWGTGLNHAVGGLELALAL